MLKKFKQVTLRSLKATRVSTMVHNSRWRRGRLLILAYHGISTDDEHLWDDSLFMSADLFRRRLELIDNAACAVLPLGEALERLRANDLPERSVAITFDDGTQDFFSRAFPILNQFGFPVTVYLSTFYSDFNRPVFDTMCAYLLWRGRSQVLDLQRLIRVDQKLELWLESSRQRAVTCIDEFARQQQLSAQQKDKLLLGLAKEVRVDYDSLLARRSLHLVNPDEVNLLASQGVDFQLHTHRHRTPMDRDSFLREITDNRNRIQALAGHRADHFCYPSGVYKPVFLPWLREADVVSATTCDFGLASAASDRLLLPRLVDVSSLSEIEFESWLTGVSAALPRRHQNRNLGRIGR
jgi:peptidoglycan/xylan/chitin deacetylase (PgdA/CDA1 family)